MKIEHALDWHVVSDDLLRQLNSINYNPDLHKMHRNIGKMATELSKLEVTYRGKRCTLLTDKVTEINNAIDRLEKFIIMAKLKN